MISYFRLTVSLLLTRKLLKVFHLFRRKNLRQPIIDKVLDCGRDRVDCDIETVDVNIPV